MGSYHRTAPPSSKVSDLAGVNKIKFNGKIDSKIWLPTKRRMASAVCPKGRVNWGTGWQSNVHCTRKGSYHGSTLHNCVCVTSSISPWCVRRFAVSGAGCYNHRCTIASVCGATVHVAYMSINGAFAAALKLLEIRCQCCSSNDRPT